MLHRIFSFIRTYGFISNRLNRMRCEFCGEEADCVRFKYKDSYGCHEVNACRDCRRATVIVNMITDMRKKDERRI